MRTLHLTPLVRAIFGDEHKKLSLAELQEKLAYVCYAAMMTFFSADLKGVIAFVRRYFHYFLEQRFVIHFFNRSYSQNWFCRYRALLYWALFSDPPCFENISRQ